MMMKVMVAFLMTILMTCNFLPYNVIVVINDNHIMCYGSLDIVFILIPML